jgi:hypothetical protein
LTESCKKIEQRNEKRISEQQTRSTANLNLQIEELPNETCEKPRGKKNNRVNNNNPSPTHAQLNTQAKTEETNNSTNDNRKRTQLLSRETKKEQR